MKTIKERLRSKVVWMSILAQVVMIIALYNQDLSEQVKTIATSILFILNTVGILNNPTTEEF